MLQRRVQRLETLEKQSKSTELSPPRRLQTAQDIIDLLQEQVAVLRATRWADALQKARAIGYLAGIARKAIETGTLADRLEMLEAVLHQRKENDKR
jgi:hypothetical protein